MCSGCVCDRSCWVTMERTRVDAYVSLACADVALSITMAGLCIAFLLRLSARRDPNSDLSELGTWQLPYSRKTEPLHCNRVKVKPIASTRRRFSQKHGRCESQLFCCNRLRFVHFITLITSSFATVSENNRTWFIMRVGSCLSVTYGFSYELEVNVQSPLRPLDFSQQQQQRSRLERNFDVLRFSCRRRF